MANREGGRRNSGKMRRSKRKVCAVAEKDAAKALETLKEAGQNAVAIGEVTQGEEGVVLC